MRAEIRPSLLTGETKEITSKSYYIRALVLAALSSKSVRLYGNNDSKDVATAIKAIETLGARVSKRRDGYVVYPVERWPETAQINVGESATLLRILTPVLAAKGVSCEIVAEGTLLKRPVFSLVQPLSEHGITFKRKTFPLRFSGKLVNGRYVISDTTTSGVISGLIIALPLLAGDSEIIADLNSFNKGYIEITLDVAATFGGDYEITQNGLKIGGEADFGIDKYNVEEDWSNASAWLVAGALAGNVTVKGLNLSSAQYDSKIIDLLSSAGADISMTEDSVSVRKSKLHAINRNMSKNLDLVPALAIACAAADGVSRLANVERLALKESNRVEELLRLLGFLSVKAEFTNGDLIIEGGKLAPNGVYAAPKDHRIVMAAAIAGALSGITIDGAEAVAKSYPRFFDEMMILGGDVCICQ